MLMGEPYDTKYELEMVFPFPQDRAILISSFQEIPQSFGNNPSLMVSEVDFCDNMQNTLKIDDF